MNREIRNALIYGGVSGAMLYFLQVVIHYLIYPCFQDATEMAFEASVAVGTLIIVAGIFINNTSFWYALLRVAIQIYAFIVSFIFGGLIRIGSLFLELNHQTLSDNNGNAIGLSTVLSLIIIFFFAIMIVLVKEVICVGIRMWKMYILKR